MFRQIYAASSTEFALLAPALIALVGQQKSAATPLLELQHRTRVWRCEVCNEVVPEFSSRVIPVVA
jgi:hypothetical protein